MPSLGGHSLFVPLQKDRVILLLEVGIGPVEISPHKVFVILGVHAEVPELGIFGERRVAFLQFDRSLAVHGVDAQRGAVQNQGAVLERN